MSPCIEKEHQNQLIILKSYNKDQETQNKNSRNFMNKNKIKRLYIHLIIV